MKSETVRFDFASRLQSGQCLSANVVQTELRDTESKRAVRPCVTPGSWELVCDSHLAFSKKKFNPFLSLACSQQQVQTTSNNYIPNIIDEFPSYTSNYQAILSTPSLYTSLEYFSKGSNTRPMCSSFELPTFSTRIPTRCFIPSDDARCSITYYLYFICMSIFYQP
jgi:hypothetical protein